MDGPITLDNQIKLKKNWKAICHDLKVTDISPDLITSGVITPEERDDLLKERTRRKQTEELLNLLLAKDDQHFERFRECLLEDYHWLAKGLAEYEVTVEDREAYRGSILKDCSLPQLPKCFVGRDKDVQKIINAFFIEGHRLAVIKAFGGQGKTALATTIGHTCVSKWGIRSVMADMKGVSHDDDIPSSLLLAMKCSLGLSSGKSNTVRLIRKACQEISSYEKKMLIILDNCESALRESTRSYFYALLNQLLSSCSNAYVLCTTRQTIQIPNEQVLLHELGTLTEENSFVVLQSYTQRVSRENSNHLAEKCGFVALLLHILGYLLQQGHRAIDIITELTSKTVFGSKLSPLIPEGLNATACINLSYERLGQEMQDAVQMLSLFQTSFNKEDAFNLLTKRRSSPSMFDCSTCLQTLCDASFLQYDAASKTYSMHGVIQAFAQEQTPQGNGNRFKEMFMALMEHRIDHIYTLAEADKIREASTFFEKDKDNLMACVGIFESLQLGSKKATYSIAKKLAFSLRQIGLFSDSLMCFKLALETVKEQQNKNPDLATLYYNIGYLQVELGESDAAVEDLSYAIAEYEKQEGSFNYIDYCKCCYYMVMYLNKAKENSARRLHTLQKCFEKAVVHQDLSMQYLAQAIMAIIKAKQGDEEAVMVTLHVILNASPAADGKEEGLSMDALHDAAVALSFIGKKAEALSFCRRAVAVAENRYGEHPGTATVMTNMGDAMVDGDIDYAIDILRKALAMNEQLLGENNVRTATTMYALGRALSVQDKKEEGISTFQKALRIQEQAPGESETKFRALAQAGLDMLFFGYTDVAVDYTRRAVDLSERLLGEYDKETATAIYTLGCTLSAHGNHADALSAYQRALRIYEQLHNQSRERTEIAEKIANEKESIRNVDGISEEERNEKIARDMAKKGYHKVWISQEIGEFLGENENTAFFIYCMGEEMLKLGNANGAVDLLRRALVMSEKKLGEYHKRTVDTLSLLSSALSAQGNHTDALSTYQRVLRAREKILGESLWTASALHGIGQEEIYLGYLDDAVEDLRRALTMKEKIQGENHEDTATTLHELARAISAQGNHTEALSTFERVLRIRELVLGESQSTASTLYCIGHELIALSKVNDAEAALRKALAMQVKILGEHQKDTAETLHELAFCISAQGNHREALSTYQNAFGIMEQVLGESQSTASALHGIGHEKIELGDATGAVKALGRALAMREKILGKSHYQTVATKFELLRATFIQGSHAHLQCTPKSAKRIKEHYLGCGTSTTSALHKEHEMVEVDSVDDAVGVLQTAITLNEKLYCTQETEDEAEIHVSKELLDEMKSTKGVVAVGRWGDYLQVHVHDDGASKNTISDDDLRKILNKHRIHKDKILIVREPRRPQLVLYCAVPAPGSKIHWREEHSKYGTLGAYASRSDDADSGYVLTCSHVTSNKKHFCIVPDNLEVIGEAEESASCTCIKGERFLSITPGNGSTLDLSIIKLNGVKKKQKEVDAMQVTLDVNSLLDKTVFKVGASTGRTTGKIMGDKYMLLDKEAYENLILVLPDDPCISSFSQPGDSGSIVRSDSHSQLVSMVIGEVSNFSYFDISVKPPKKITGGPPVTASFSINEGLVAASEGIRKWFIFDHTAFKCDI